MSYQHVLVTVDLSDVSKALVDKAIEQAKPDNSKLSILYVDESHLRDDPKETAHLEAQLQHLADTCGYPVTDTAVVIGDLHMKVAGLVETSDIDLVVCGHHHSLVSRMFSSVPKLVNNVKADLLVVYIES
ncbi:universal stress protein [Marinobacterium stanieri]|uniref:Universal stress protein n=1 Tax=Marinobacterium stanieri TaxID=49186 RepID=A0A1N6UVI3_9GAMM|nr:universal stress protein [Marinobacterium stanieri]SIQ69551.1 universal stress protein A [Marinobacterium stanieri]